MDSLRQILPFIKGGHRVPQAGLKVLLQPTSNSWTRCNTSCQSFEDTQSMVAIVTDCRKLGAEVNLTSEWILFKQKEGSDQILLQCSLSNLVRVLL